MANSGKTVIVACLDGTFQRKAFGDVSSSLAAKLTVVFVPLLILYVMVTGRFWELVKITAGELAFWHTVEVPVIVAVGKGGTVIVTVAVF